MKKKRSKYSAGEELPGTEQEFIAIESEPNDRNPYILVNPSDYSSTKGLVAFQFGAYGDTRLLVWANGWDTAAETAAEWLSEYAPGHVTSESDVAQLMKEAKRNDPSLDEEAAHDAATADLTYTESGYLTSYEMHGNDVHKGEPMYEAALQASKEEAVGDPPSGGLAGDRYLLGQFVEMTAESMELENYQDAEPNEGVVEVARAYDSALWLALNELVDRLPPENGASAEDLWDAEAPFLVLMTLRGEGVGIWDGSWDEFYSDTDAAGNFLEARLKQFASGSGSGLFEGACVAAAEESCGD